MKKISVWLTICISITLIIILYSATPGKTESNSYLSTVDLEETTGGHTGLCLDCHFTDDLHSEPEHSGPNDCNTCHDGDPERGNVQATACIKCHPKDNPGQCRLANTHAYEACLKCHFECLEGDTTTTTIAVLKHFSICTQCHLSDDLHINEGHLSTCLDCHEGETKDGNVKAYTCAACHTGNNPGKCSITKLHNKTLCGNCHNECTDNDNNTSTVPPLLIHGGLCSECHSEADLHSNPAHSNCTICHAGALQAGTVEADSCITNGCHPAGNPGKCNLVETNEHLQSTCLNCHFDCTDNESSGGETPSFSVHIDLCSECHYEDDLHENTNHSVCTLCHDISEVTYDNPTGPVTATTCTACHPLNNPDLCIIIKSHGLTTCLECHFECNKGSDNSTTTTTIQSPGTTTTTTEVPSTTTVSRDCPSEVVLKNRHDDLETLRDFRDEILYKSRGGRKYIALYYRHAPEVSLMILSDKGLRTEAEAAIRSIIPDIKLLIENESADALSSRACTKIEKLLDKISDKARPGLKSAIRQFKADLENNI